MPFGLGFFAAAGGAAGGVDAYEHISTVSVSTTSASITFSAIPQDYKHLQIRYMARGNATQVTYALQMRVNGQTSANYSRHALFGGSSNNIPQSTASTANTSINIGLFPGGNESANIFGGGIIDILDYSSSDKYKSVKAFAGATYGSYGARLSSGASFLNLNAITSLNFDHYDTTSSFVAGTRFSLYGIRG